MSKRIVVVGTSGSGKSTLAKEISLKLSIPHIELDDLYWQPNWEQCSKKELKNKVIELIQGDTWVMDGNYGDLIGIVWGRATTLVWLDYPFYLIFYRALKRSLIWIRNKEKIRGNNYESYQRLFSKQSILLWVIKTYWRRKKQLSYYPTLPEYQHLKVIRLRSPKETLHFKTRV